MDIHTDNNQSNARPEIGLVEWFRPGEETRVEKVLAELKELGVTALRTGISWADYYTPAGKNWYHWLLPRLAQEVNLLPCFLSTPAALGIAPRTSAPLINPKDFADFLDVIITDLGEHFEWVELWNEPNNKLEYDYTLDNSWFRFAEMVGGAAYWARHRGKKTALGGMSPIDPNWLQLMFDRGVMPYIDAVGIHGFPDVFDQNWEGWAENIAKVKKVLNQHNSSAQIWITAAGFSTWQHDEFKQLQEFRNILQADVARVYWYSLHDLDADLAAGGGFHVDEREYYFGLKHPDGTPKLLYRLWAENGIDGLNQLTCLQRKINYNSAEKYTLITGGAGFVGTNLAKRLLQEGKRVLILDNLSRPGVERNLQWLYDNYQEHLEICVADIRDLPTVKRLVQHAEQIFHFAAQVAVTTSLHSPITDFEINARGIINILEAIRAQDNPPPLVFTSTNKVYGGLEDLLFIADGSRYNPSDKTILKYGIGEARSLDFHSPYGCSKGSADQYVIDYARTYGILAVVFRMSCIYGPHQYGNEDQGWVAHFAIRAIENKPISIYGDGKQVRDVLFVEDLVDAFLLAQQHMPAISGQAFNIGGGPENTTSLLELLELIGDFQGQKIPLEFGDWRPGDQHYYVSDIRKFKKATGWYPKNAVPEGVFKLYQWLCATRGISLPAEFTPQKKKESIYHSHCLMNAELIAVPELTNKKNSTMRAAVVVAPQVIEITEVNLPQPGPTQVRLKMEGCGLCASNIPVWQGREWFSYPMVAGNPGHEGWGIIDAIGEEVTTAKVGERVAAITYNAYAEYDLAEADSLVKLPTAFENIPFPGEPLGCAINIFKRCDIQAGQTIAIIGIGFLGALLVQLAKQAGARVIALSQRDYSLTVAQECGADETIKLDDHYQIIQKVKELTAGNFCPRVIECTGKEWPLNVAGELTAERGKLIIAGYHQDGLRAVNVQLWNWRGLDVINAHERDPRIYLQGIQEAVAAVLSGRIDPQPLYTHAFSLADIPEAFRMLQNRPDGFMKALIRF